MKKHLKKIIVLSVVGLFVVYVGYQIFQYTNRSYKTETILSYTAEDAVSIKGVFVRKEKVIEDIRTDSVHYLIDDGSKVSGSTKVAEMYGSEREAALQLQVNKLEELVAVLEQSQNEGALASYDADLVSNQINQRFMDIGEMISTGDMKNFYNVSNELLVYLNRRNISLGKAENYSEEIGYLKSQISSIKSQISSSPKEIYAPSFGYFVSETDGYEGVLTSSYVDSASAGDLIKTLNGVFTSPKNTQGSYIGKIIEDYNWQYVFSANSEMAKRFSVGQTVNVDFSFTGERNIRMTVSKILIDETTNESAVVLSSDIMNEYLSYARVQDARIIFNSFEGLKISKGALRMKDNKHGVYIKLGNQIKFKHIDVVFEGDNYILSELNYNDSHYVQLYDEIVVEGKDLYDGKHIN